MAAAVHDQAASNHGHLGRNLAGQLDLLRDHSGKSGGPGGDPHCAGGEDFTGGVPHVRIGFTIENETRQLTVEHG